jgi:large subunit ribosomal protein L26e
VTIVRGSNKGTSGKIKNVYRRRWCLYVEKIQRQTKKGALVQIPINPSNVKLTKLVITEDRKSLIQRKREGRGLEKGKYTRQEVAN